MKAQYDFYFDEIFKDYKDLGEIQAYGNDKLGKGAFGIVKEVKYKNKICAGKLIVKQSSGEVVFSEDLKGPNIVKIYKICRPIIKYGNTYQLIIMEKAILNDLGKLNIFFHNKNLLRLIFKNAFNKELSDSLLRFYTKQLINGFAILYKNNFVHFDIKPENILITNNLTLKLSDFSVLQKVVEPLSKIPGGTVGYLSPEYYKKKETSPDDARKQDYFALGSTLFYLKYGDKLLNYKKDESNDIIMNKIVEELMRDSNYLYSRKSNDRHFIIFLNHLLHINPDYRYDFREIFMNKWVNTNLDSIEKVADIFENDEEMFLMELQKLDFILQKKKIFKGIDDDEDDDSSDDEKSNNKSNSEKKKKKINRKKFRFKKKIED